jgi:hypothetical protein
MSELTEALECIRDWLEENNPYEFSHLRAGLSRDEIDELVKDLPFTIPEEVYELYQWHDGRVDQFIHNSYNFMSLQESISAYQEEVSENSYNSREEAYFFEQSFPVFQLRYRGDVFYTIVTNGENKGKVILYDPECRSYLLRYPNLTSLVKHSAEWCEAHRNYEENREINRDVRAEANLDTKYMLREHIADCVSKIVDRFIR